MTSTETKTTQTEDLVVHFVGGGLIVPTSVDHEGRVNHSENFAYGAELVVTPEILAATRRRTSAGIFDLSEEQQQARWGQVKIRRGPWPEGRTRHQPGTIRWSVARDEALAAAWAQPTEQTQRAAMARVNAEFGPAVPKQGSVFVNR